MQNELKKEKYSRHHGPHLFQKGHTLSKGKGRPPGSNDSGRIELTKMFLQRCKEDWPKLMDQIFEQAHKGNQRMLAMIVEFAMAKPTHITIEAEAPRQIETLDDADNMSTTELRAIMTQYVQSKRIEGLPIDQNGELLVG